MASCGRGGGIISFEVELVGIGRIGGLFLGGSTRGGKPLSVCTGGMTMGEKGRGGAASLRGRVCVCLQDK